MKLTIPWYMWVLMYTGVAFCITAVFLSRASCKAIEKRELEKSDKLGTLAIVLQTIGYILATGLGLVCLAVYS